MTPTITNRTRIQVRTTTCPADFGWDGTPTGWLAFSPDYVGSPRTALAWYRDWRAKIGHGTYHAVEFRVARTGDVISMDDLRSVVALAWLGAN